MTTCLVFGYETQEHDSDNPSGRVSRALDGSRIGGAKIVSVVLPLDSTVVVEQIEGHLLHHRPILAIALGVARSAVGLQVERTAVNIRDFQIPDGCGNQWSGLPIVDNGPPSYFSTVPVKAMVAAIRSVGIPARLSNSASTHMCNQALYAELHTIHTTGLDCRAGFIHVPNVPEYVALKREWGPSMSLDHMVLGARAAIQAALEVRDDISSNVQPWEW